MADVKDQDGLNRCEATQNASDVLDTTEADRIVLKTVKKWNATDPLSGSAQGILEDVKQNSESSNECSKHGCTDSEIKSWSQWKRIFKLRLKRSIKCFPILDVPKIPGIKSCTIGGNPVLNDCMRLVKNFTLSDLRTATKNFSNENIIGRGGFAEVYKGRLQDGMLVAVKRLTRGTPDDITGDFLIELGIIAHIDHPNTVKFIGCCTEGGMHLVFHLSKLGSLRSHLHDFKGKPLDWSQRYKIALGTADGLAYLHEDCRRRIIHRDIKADNILLSEDYTPQICDFGLAKWLPSQLTHYNMSKYGGTAGYFAPESLTHGTVSEKTDVYAFGVLLVELITGCRASDESAEGIIVWAKPLLDDNDIQKLLDPALDDDYDVDELDRMLLTASLCVEQSPILRPRMSQAAILLRGDDSALACGKNLTRVHPEATLGKLLESHE